jgi:hypothetical protein
VRVSLLSLKTKVDGLPVVWPQNHWDSLSVVWPQNHYDSFSWFGLKIGGGGFVGLSLKTDSYDLVICASKLPRWFLILYLKTKRTMVCRLRDKIDGRMKTVQGTRRDLTAWFGWKQVRLGFFSLPQNLRRRNGGWYTWHYHGGRVRIKLNTDGSMRRLHRTMLPLFCRVYGIRS